MDHFEKIDMEQWPRAEIYRLYTEQWTTITYTVNQKLSVEKLVPYLKARGIKFTPAIIWLVSRELNRIENFRLSIQDGNLGTWNVIHPYYPTLNTYENMTFHSIDFQEDFWSFYHAYLAEQQENGHKTNLWATKIPANSFMVSVAPWLQFDSVSMQLKNAKGYYAPYVAIGQYDKEWKLPCAIMANHAAADGWHIAKFFAGLQEAMNAPEQWCL